MKKILFVFLLLSKSCFAQIPGQPFGPPPFSNIYEKPVLSPYVFIDPNFSMPYYSRVVPLMTQEKQQLEIQRQNKKIYRLQNEFKSNENLQRRNQIIQSAPMRPTGQNSGGYQNLNQGIRPTGHSSYFMNNFNYY